MSLYAPHDAYSSVAIWQLIFIRIYGYGYTTMSHTVEYCHLTKLNGGLSRLHSADEDAVSWLTSYGKWHAYEKKTDTQLQNFQHNVVCHHGTHFKLLIVFLQPSVVAGLTACVVVVHAVWQLTRLQLKHLTTHNMVVVTAPVVTARAS